MYNVPLDTDSYYLWFFCRFMTVVKQAVERLDNMEESYSSVLTRLGVRHSANIAFCSEYFKLFTQSMLYIWQYNLKGKIHALCDALHLTAHSVHSDSFLNKQFVVPMLSSGSVTPPPQPPACKNCHKRNGDWMWRLILHISWTPLSEVS